MLYKHVPNMIDEHVFPKNLMQFDMSKFNIILGMDYLTIHVVSIDYKDLKPTSSDEESREICFYGERNGKRYPINSIMKASKLLKQGSIGFLCYSTNVEEGMKIEDICVAYEFPDVFPTECLGLPPQREIDFKIELVLSAQPILKALYMMALTELKELKT